MSLVHIVTVSGLIRGASRTTHNLQPTSPRIFYKLRFLLSTNAIKPSLSVAKQRLTRILDDWYSRLGRSCSYGSTRSMDRLDFSILRQFPQIFQQTSHYICIYSTHVHHGMFDSSSFVSGPFNSGCLLPAVFAGGSFRLWIFAVNWVSSPSGTHNDWRNH